MRDGGRHHHRRRGGGERSSRLFNQGELRHVVLALIAEKPRHGYELIKEVEERVSGSYSPSPGVIYPTLLMLEELGHTIATDVDGKRRYAITPAGLSYIDENREAVAAAMRVMDDARSAYGNGPAPQVLRAMESLKMALRMRYERSALTEEQNRSIAAAIDAATLAIERL